MALLQGKKIAILVTDGFEQVELEQPREALENAGAKTFIIAPKSGYVKGWHHHEKGDDFKVDKALDEEEISVADFDALLLPGGVINPDALRICAKAIELIKNFNTQKKPIAAICHGPWPLINANVVKGKQVTSWLSLKVDLENAGAYWQDKTTVVSENLLTSRNPDDIPKFNQAMLNLFK